MAAQPRRRRLETEDIGDVTLIRFTDKRIIGEQIIQAIGEQLSSLVEDRQRRKLLLNFANVEYLSSAALGKLIRLNKRLKAAGGRMVLCNIQTQIYDILETTKMDHLFDMKRLGDDGPEAGLADALARLQARPPADVPSVKEAPSHETD
jgi:anti-sigma B factor antagonist